MLGELRAAGLRFMVEGRTLYVEPASALTDAQRVTIRANKATLLRELAEEARERGRAIAAARDVAPLADFRAALTLGRLHVCCNCGHFSFGVEPAGLGHCERFNVEAWPFVPFWCAGFEASDMLAAATDLKKPESARAGSM